MNTLQQKGNKYVVGYYFNPQRNCLICQLLYITQFYKKKRLEEGNLDIIPNYFKDQYYKMSIT